MEVSRRPIEFQVRWIVALKINLEPICQIYIPPCSVLEHNVELKGQLSNYKAKKIREIMIHLRIKVRKVFQMPSVVIRKVMIDIHILNNLYIV